MIHLTFEDWATSKAGPITMAGQKTSRQKAARQVADRFRRRGESLIAARQRMVEGQTGRLVAFLQAEAPRKTGIFAEGIRGDVSQAAWGESTAQIAATGEHAFLLPFFVHGTKAHEIPTGGAAAQIAKGYPLRFYWENGPNGPGIYRYWRVWHPGTKPNPFIDRALRKWRVSAMMALRQVALDVAADKTSQST